MTIDDLLGSAREGLSGALVVRGETGVGKTALLEYAAEQADGFRVVRLTGVEAERQLGYAALHQLLFPMLDRIRRLPFLQREALNSALGLAHGPPADPVLVGLGLISVADDVARADGPVLCVVDDAQWVDAESIGALAFWARRLHADGVAVMFGERSSTMSASPLEGLPVLEVGGLEPDAARALLVSEAPIKLDRDVVDRILAETEGNPLAIIEIASGLTPDNLVGWAAAPQPLPLSRRLEAGFAGQAGALAYDTRMFLLLVSADGSAEATLVWQAADRLGVKRESAEEAEAAGLILLGPPIRYRHPLIRSAVYGAAAPADRRAVHGALAAVTGTADGERRAWHLAAATLGPNEEVAGLLEGCAARAVSSGATSAAVALLSRAADLTPDQEHAAERRVAAAEAAVERGLLRQTHFLIEHAAPALRDATWHARAERVSGLVDLREGNLLAAAPRLRDAAAGLLRTDPVLGRRTLLEAVDIAVYRGDAGQSEFMRSVAATGAHVPLARASVAGHLFRAFSTCAEAGYAAAVPEYRKTIEFCRDAPTQDLVPWTNLIAAVTRSIWDDAGHDLLLRRVADWSRARGSLFPLWLALLYSAAGAAWRGDAELRSALFDQAADVLSVTGEFAMLPIGATLDALRGQQADALAKIPAALDSWDYSANAFALHAALLDVQISRAKYQDALQSALVLFDADPMMAGPHLLPDMIEAAVRVGDSTAAEKAMARLRERATAAGTPWALGLLARSEALMAGDRAEEHYALALGLFGVTPMHLQQARTHLLYGEWLRRARRNIDARGHLRNAHEMFAAMSAEGFAERARVELVATGQRAPKRTVQNSNDLTAQEAQISKLVGQGASNAEIAAQLFVSQRTVEYHLHKVFRKLGVKSRTQLARVVLEKGR